MLDTIPNFLKEKIAESYGEEQMAKILNGYKNEKTVTFRVNTLKTDKQKIKNELDKRNIRYKEVLWYQDAMIIESVKEDEIRKLPIYENGEIYLQNLSSMIPPIILEPQENENILDMAAAPGGKTTQMAALSKNKAMITACEKNKIRLDRLKYNLNKQGATRVNAILQDARKLDDFFSFDKILLDAPCSGSGTLSALNESFNDELIERSVKLQEELLNKAIKILKKNGEIVYSTCSILKEENEFILNKVMKRGDVEIVPIDKELLKGIPTLLAKIEGTICVAPNEIYEGFFVAKIKKLERKR